MKYPDSVVDPVSGFNSTTDSDADFSVLVNGQMTRTWTNSIISHLIKLNRLCSISQNNLLNYKTNRFRLKTINTCERLLTDYLPSITVHYITLIFGRFGGKDWAIDRPSLT